MSGWYEQTPVDSALVRIGEPRVGALLSANLWWLRGSDRDIVVDAGLGVVDLREHIPRMFERDPEDGDRVDLGGRTLTVLYLPGHSPVSIAPLEEHSGMLFSGDVIYDGHLIDNLPESDLPSYRHSLERLVHLDVAVVHPGHGASFDQTRMRVLVDAYLRASPG